MTRRLLPLLLAALLLPSLLAAQPGVPARSLSPFDYGLRQAQSDTARYWVLYHTHRAALQQGVEVDYRGIDSLTVEVPPAAKSIPLGPRTDFQGLVLTVRNYSKHHTLFTLAQSATPVALPKERLDGDDFSDIDSLAQPHCLLVLSDQTPWVAERIGYGSPAMRRDILLLRDGRPLNRPVAPWGTPATQAQCSYCVVDTAQKRVENLTLRRAADATHKSYLLYATLQDNLLIRNIRVYTPKSKLLADGIFQVTNSTRVRFEDIYVDGTYSKAGVSTGYGYAFSLNNLWDTRFVRVRADGNWGVFGSNCLSQTLLDQCDINRFDIHCYGRDARMVRCTFQNKQTQFSSMYGTVQYDSCAFIDCIPLRIRSSYNAYTPFDVVMNHCTFEPTLRYHALVNLMLLDTNDNSRPELNPKCMPNIEIHDMTVRMPLGLGRIDVVDPTGATSECQSRSWHYISRCHIDSLRTERGGRAVRTRLYLSSRPIRTDGAQCRLRHVDLGGGRLTVNLLTPSKEPVVVEESDLRLEGSKE